VGIGCAYLLTSIINLAMGGKLNELQIEAPQVIDAPFLDGVYPNISKEILTPQLSEQAPMAVDVWMSFMPPSQFWEQHDKDPESVG
jgi:hypothetical protein